MHVNMRTYAHFEHAIAFAVFGTLFAFAYPAQPPRRKRYQVPWFRHQTSRSKLGTQSALWLQSRSNSAEQKPFCMKVTGRDMRDRKDVAMT